MSEVKHTPSPWLLPIHHTQHVPGSTANGQGDWQCYVNPSSNDHQYCPAIGCGPSAEVAEANTQRIVECVNACEGIVDPSAVPKLLEAVELWMKVWTTPPSEMSEQEKLNIRIRAGELSRKALENATGKKLLR